MAVAEQNSQIGAQGRVAALQFIVDEADTSPSLESGDTPSNSAPELEVAKAAIRSGSYKRAVDVLSSVLTSQNSATSPAHYYRALARIALVDYDAALADGDWLRLHASALKSATIIRSLVYLATEQYDKVLC